MKRLWIVLLSFLLSPILAHAQYAPITGFCVNGALPAITSGLPSSNYNQNLIPRCTVTVVLTGTTTPATIYADKNGTTLSNPFTANTDASWTFYVASPSSQLYDITLSGGIPPNAYSLPRTMTGISPFGGGGGSGGAPGGTTFDSQYNLTSTTFGGAHLSSYNTSFGYYDKQPKVDVRHPDFGTPAGCPNAADPTGVLDSTCAIQAAVNYVPTIFSPSHNGPYPCVYLAPGFYHINGTLRVPKMVSICGDGIPTAWLIQMNAAASAIVVYGGTLGVITAFAEESGSLTGFGIACGLQGNPGKVAPYTGCTGTAVQTEGMTDYDVTHIQVSNWGGRGFNAGNGTEQMHFRNNWFTDVRWPVAGIGQANGDLSYNYAAGAGQDDSGFCFAAGVCSPQGVSFSHTYNPTAVTLASASVDGASHATVTVNCTPTPNCYNEGVNGTSSPIDVGGLFQILGVTDPNLPINGVWQATAISGSPGGPFSITFTLFTGGVWNYGPNGEQLIYFCGNNVTCATTPTTAYSSSSLGTAMFRPTVMRPANEAFTEGGATNTLFDNRIDTLWFANGLHSEGADVVDGLYTECFNTVFPCMSSALIIGGGYRPYTTLTGTAPTGTGAVPVLNTNWFQNYTADPTQASDISSMGLPMTVYPCDYNPTQTGTPSLCNPAVNTNQTESVTGTFSTDGFHFTSRCYGGGAICSGNTGPAWAAGSTIAYQFLGANGLQQSRFIKLRVGGDSVPTNPQFWDYTSQCSDTKGSQCSSLPIGAWYDPAILPSGTSTGAGEGVIIENLEFNIGLNGPSPVTASQCIKLFDGVNLTLIGVTGGVSPGNKANAAQNAEPPMVTNGSVTKGMSHCVMLAHFPNVFNSNTISTNSASVNDVMTNSMLTCPGGALSSTGCRLKTDLVWPSSDFGNTSFGGASPGYSVPFGSTFTTSNDEFDTASVAFTGTTTAWTWNPTAGTVTWTSTAFPLGGNFAYISGCVIGSIFNTPTGYDTGYRISASSSTSFTTNISNTNINAPYNQPTSATENCTVTTYLPGMRFNRQGGPQFTGVNVGWDFDLMNASKAWVKGLVLRQDATQGSMDISTPSTTFWGLTNYPNTGADTGSVNVLAATIVPAIGALTDGLKVFVLPANNSTSTNPSLNVNGLGAKTIVKAGASGEVALASGDLNTGIWASLTYHLATSHWQLGNPANPPTATLQHSDDWEIPTSVFATSTMLGPPYYELNGGTIKAVTARLTGTISCTVAPIINILDLGTSVSTAYGSGTSLATLATGTATGAFTSTGLSAAIAAGHYIGLGFSAGTCATPPQIDATATIQ